MKASPWISTAALLLIACHATFAQSESSEDFEHLAQALPGWGATFTKEDKSVDYRAAAKWDTPFSFALDEQDPHSGARSLRWEFSDEINQAVSLAFPMLKTEGSEVELTFFVRTDGVPGNGRLSVSEADENKQRLKSYFEAATIPASDQWTKVTWKGKLGPGTAGLRIAIGYPNMPPGAKIWIDDISVESK